MKKTAVILAAHGSRHEPTVNAQLRAWAAQVAARNAFDEVAVAFHQGLPTFSEALDTLTAEEVTVVPVMTSAGYYSDIELPRELAQNRRYPQLSLLQTTPVGLHPAVPDLIAKRANFILNSDNFTRVSSRDVSLALVGHGTPRHPASRSSTLSIVEQLRNRATFGEVIALFLDDQPPVDELLNLARKQDIVVIPFLIAAGPHAISDIPKRIGMSALDASGPPFAGMVAGRRVLCDIPFGSYPKMIDLILDLALPKLGNALHGAHPRQKEVA